MIEKTCWMFLILPCKTFASSSGTSGTMYLNLASFPIGQKPEILVNPISVRNLTKYSFSSLIFLNFSFVNWITLNLSSTFLLFLIMLNANLSWFIDVDCSESGLKDYFNLSTHSVKNSFWGSVRSGNSGTSETWGCSSFRSIIGASGFFDFFSFLMSESIFSLSFLPIIYPEYGHFKISLLIESESSDYSSPPYLEDKFLFSFLSYLTD